MRRPAYQHYPADWRNNTNLRRCSWAARGAWVDILGFMHDSDEYGVLRWKLSEIGKAVGCPAGLVRELVFYSVMKGSDVVIETPYVYTPMSGRKRGPDVTLIPVQQGPIWFSSRMVRDEHVRLTRGASTRFGGDYDDTMPPAALAPKAAPTRRQGDGSTSSSSSSLNTKSKAMSDSAPPNADVVSLSEAKTKAANGERRRLAEELLAFLNARTGRHYRAVDANVDLLLARLKEGATPGEIRAVIVRKCRDWKGTDMDGYLRPETLFNRTKFAQYIGEVPPPESSESEDAAS